MTELNLSRYGKGGLTVKTVIPGKRDTLSGEKRNKWAEERGRSASEKGKGGRGKQQQRGNRRTKQSAHLNKKIDISSPEEEETAVRRPPAGGASKKKKKKEHGAFQGGKGPLL